MFDFWSVLGVRDGVVAVAIDQGDIRRVAGRLKRRDSSCLR